MIAADIAFGFLAGAVSCLTPESLLLFPLVLGAAGANDRAGVIASAIGLGLSLILTGLVAGSLGFLFGFEAIWFRRIVCAFLALQGIVLLSASTAERFPLLMGSYGSALRARGAASRRDAFRLLLLAVFVGANWVPLVGPTLGKASLMAADTWNSGPGLAILFVFGIGAAAPWIFLGRLIRLLSRPYGGGVLDGMAGKRLLGLVLLAVAILGGTGLDIAMEHWLDARLPAWTWKLATRF
jgi:cytochrome c biogenesis protein CcdA